MWLANDYCASMLFDMLDAFDKTQAELTPPETATTNAFLVSKGCSPIVTAASVAEDAYASIHFPKPSGDRSPGKDQLYDGYPFTYVGLWTYFWTDPNSWRPLSATASVAGLTATVTAEPVALIFDPGDGSAPLTCDGPGRAWSEADGNDAPSDGACAFQYRQVTSSPITSTQTIVWKITWTGTGSGGGQIPRLSTSTSGQLQVMQIQTVVTR